MSLAAFDGATGGKPGKFREGLHSSKSAFPEAWAMERMRELAALSMPEPEVLEERALRARLKPYYAMKQELAERRAAASDTDVSVVSPHHSQSLRSKRT